MILYDIKHYKITDVGSQGMYFRPLVYISFAVDSFISGDRALWFHSVNLFLHIIASLGVAACADIMLRKRYAGLTAGLVFALHPVHPEAVTWIAGRYDVMCGMLIAWSFYTYISSNYPGAKRPRLMRIASLILFILACLSKEMAFSFPLVLLAYELLIRRDGDVALKPALEKIKRMLPFFIIAGIYFCLRYLKLGGIGGYGDLESLSFLDAIYRTLIQPIRLLLFPMNRLLFAPAGLTAVIITGAVFLAPLAMLAFSRPIRLIAFCVAAVILCILPTAHIGVNELRFESSRFLYIPSIFFTILIAGLFTGIGKSNTRTKAASILLFIYMFILLLTTHQNNYPWIVTGRLVKSAEASTEILIDRYSGRWGTEKKMIVAFNVPMTYLGAAALVNGLPAMLRLNHEEEMKDVGIKVIYSGRDTWREFHSILRLIENGVVVWVFDDMTYTFVEYSNNGEFNTPSPLEDKLR